MTVEVTEYSTSGEDLPLPDDVKDFVDSAIENHIEYMGVIIEYDVKDCKPGRVKYHAKHPFI